MVLDGRQAILRNMAGGRPRPATGLPPHNVAAEEAVIAALLLDADHCVEAGLFGMLDGSDFFRDQNGWIFEACRRISERGEDVTWVTVAHELTRDGRIDEAGGEPYLTETMMKHFTAVGVGAHARIVASDSLYRRLIAAAGQIAQIAYEGVPGETERVLEVAAALIDGIRTGASNVIPAAHRFGGGYSLEGL